MAAAPAPRLDERTTVKRYLDIRSNQLQETKEIIAAFAITRDDAMTRLKSACEQIRLYDSFHHQTPVDQKQPFAQNLLDLSDSRTKYAADVAFFTMAIEEQQKNLERLTELTSLFDESGVIAQCEQCRTNICPTQLDHCQPITSLFALPLCPTCSTQADKASA